jgi:EmrB/QacA subfamily drug resistance transporter
MTTQSLIQPRPRLAGGSLSALRASRWAPLPVVLTGVFMVVLDFFIVNVAMPSMQGSLHTGASSLEWVAAGYALASAVLLITGARLGDRLGRRRVFALGLGLFTLSSALCGAAPDPTVLVAGRLVQGVGGALLMPNVLSIIGVLYVGADRARALAAYGLVMGLAAVGGQLIGGALVALDPAGLGWRSCFLINVPIGLAALAAVPACVPESRGESAAGLDIAGVVLATVGITAIVLPLVEGRTHGWPAWTWISLALAPVILAAFVAHQRALTRRGGSPLLHLPMFTDRTFSSGLLVQTVFWSGQASFFLILALYLQQGRGLSALHAGLVFTILAGSYLVASMRSPALALRYGRDVLTVAGVVLACGHLTLLAAVAVVGVGGSIAALVPGLLLVGAGMGLGIAPLATIVLGGMRPEHAGAASGALSTAQGVGNALGVAVVGVVYFGALHAGDAAAFERGLAVLAVALLLVAGLSRLIPAPVVRAAR